MKALHLGVVVGLLAPACFAQLVVEPPQVFIWATRPSVAPPDSDHVFASMTHVNVRDDSVRQDNPRLAAREAARLAIEHIEMGRIRPDQVCILLQNFGHHDRCTEQYGGQNCPSHAASRTRFFQEADRLELLLGDPLAFPNGYFVDDLNYYTHRTFRHPFLNRDFDPLNPVGQCSTAVLRKWMDEFIDEYQIIQAERLPQETALPDPSRFFFDTETLMVLPPIRNDVLMFAFLASRPEIWGTGPTGPHAGWEVPGYAPGTTLWSLYEAARLQNGWSAGVPPLITSTNVDANDPRNRPYMLFWYEVCDRATNAQMKSAAYDPIHQAWPGCVVGNYDHSRSDGAADTFGSFMDRARDSTPLNENDDTFSESDVYPRGQIHAQWTGGRMAPVVDAAHDPDKLVRWHMIKQFASGASRSLVHRATTIHTVAEQAA